MQDIEVGCDLYPKRFLPADQLTQKKRNRIQDAPLRECVMLLLAGFFGRVRSVKGSQQHSEAQKSGNKPI